MDKKVYITSFLIGGIILFTFVANIKRQSHTDPPSKVKKDISYGCTYDDLSGNINFNDRTAIYNGQRVDIPQLAFDTSPSNVLGSTSQERWVEVDLSEQILYAWEGNELFMETSISSGLPWYPTPTGEFRIWIKLRATKMEGGSGSTYYYLPNVPYVMFFENEQVPGWRGYGLHGTYWHDDFGTQRSHGCVNLPTEKAKQLYYWLSPELPEGSSVVKSSEQNPGARVIIHE